MRYLLTLQAPVLVSRSLKQRVRPLRQALTHPKQLA
jgi:hypothetical protein